MTALAIRAQRFLDLHAAEPILIMLNAWDVGSARVLEHAGAQAIGTTSMGISAALGYPDLQLIPRDEMLAVVARIVEAVQVPVSADLEAGYGDTTNQVVESALCALECGIVGINLEDATGPFSTPLLDVEIMVERVAAIRAAADAQGIHLVINARTDTFLRSNSEADDPIATAITRGNAYREAGADCIFVPARVDGAAIRRLVEGIDGPINILANPVFTGDELPTLPQLQELGVARASVGSGLMRATLGLTRRAAVELLTDGTYGTMRDELSQPGAIEAYEAAIGGLAETP
jgi:2-methylisocitrate lyase-like PEP mutase family enzyme